jgi:hypothetical protein
VNAFSNTRLALGLGLVIALIPVLAACANEAATNPPGNLFVNPGFEEGKNGWTSLTTEAWVPEYQLSDTVSLSGDTSAHLAMSTTAESPETLIWGVVQEVTPEAFPEVLSGAYRVEGWERRTGLQYMQVVVIAFDAENTPIEAPNYQIRYILAGIDQPPFAIGNAKYVFLEPGEPAEGKWIHFRRNVRDDFEDLWQVVPEDFSRIRVLFEVRYDAKVPGELPSADVYYDDLYLGSDSG